MYVFPSLTIRNVYACIVLSFDYVLYIWVNTELDTTDTVEVFKLQLYTLTRVRPEDQKIIGIVKGSALKDDVDLSTLDIKEVRENTSN